MADDKEFTEGLEDVVAGKSAICDVNGKDGKLIYSGYDIHDLAQHTTFEEVVYLLWNGRLPNRDELTELNAQLDANRAIPAEALELIKRFPKTATPMDALRTAVSLLGFYDPDHGDESIEANRRKAIRVTAQIGTIVAALDRLRKGEEPLEPKAGLGTAGNFLYLLSGVEPNATATKALDVALVLHADHELNASTFAARVTVATLTDLYSGVTSAVGTLAGPLHGGANINVMHLLEKIGTPDKAEAVVSGMLAEGKKIPGIGHRVYRALDPRAVSLREMSKQLAEATGETKWFEMSEKVQEAADAALAAKGKTTLKANVDFYSASVYHVLGIPTDLFTPVFAVSRIAGWTAHILEQYGNNRLIRPRAIYIGPRDLTVVPIDQR
ncbi:citrate synthase 2 [Capsulimonas corticalis]|uniref:Citrate synthase n=1 Tax=Capsulimonas corticalis TaxID=2219043 RepID=A0A402CXC1_9BACT|nr:citrate synthase [Capsulimonas corticalis]BDI32321.1 citrate synthase 2 [Capsulimonas corticalis]